VGSLRRRALGPHGEAGGPALYKLLGASRSEVPVYASGGWLVPLDELVQEALDYKAQGFRHYKMKVGCADVREDLGRVEAVRSALGDGVEVMVDANQGWTVKKSIAVAPRLLEMGVRWLESRFPRGITAVRRRYGRAPRSRSWRANPSSR